IFFPILLLILLLLSKGTSRLHLVRQGPDPGIQLAQDLAELWVRLQRLKDLLFVRQALQVRRRSSGGFAQQGHGLRDVVARGRLPRAVTDPVVPLRQGSTASN